MARGKGETFGASLVEDSIGEGGNELLDLLRLAEVVWNEAGKAGKKFLRAVNVKAGLGLRQPVGELVRVSPLNLVLGCEVSRRPEFGMRS